MTQKLPSPGHVVTCVKPIILGGHPTDPENRMVVTQQQHFELTRYWNKVIRQLRENEGTQGV
jgi:hypothetical protein